MYLINPYVYILLALIMTSQYVCAVLVLCQCAPVSTHTGLLYSQSGDTHAVAEVTCANKVFKTALDLISHWVYWSNYLTFINVNFYSSLSSNTTYCSELRRRGGTLFPALGHRALIRFPLHFCTVCKRSTLRG